MRDGRKVPFVKVQGLGNDFVVVDLRDGRVGADGILAILPGTAGDARMRVLNADGSEAEMCGNGIRCVAKVLYESDPALRRSPLRIDTGAGLLSCALDIDGGGEGGEQGRSEVRSVAVEMGRPRF